MMRPKLVQLLEEAEPGDIILIEQVDRLSRLDDAVWEALRKQITDKQLSIVSLDLPTSHLTLNNAVSDEFTRSMLKAINGMMLDMLAAISRKDFEDRRRRQAEGISKAKAEGKYRGRVADAQKHKLIRTLRLTNGNVTVIPDDDIMEHRSMAALTLLQKHIHQRGHPDGQAGESADSEGFVRELAQRVPQHGDALMTIAQQLEQKGIEKGIQLGEQKGKLEVARSLLKTRMPIESVQEATGLSEDDLAQIRH